MYSNYYVLGTKDGDPRRWRFQQKPTEATKIIQEVNLQGSQSWTCPVPRNQTCTVPRSRTYAITWSQLCPHRLAGKTLLTWRIDGHATCQDWFVLLILFRHDPAAPAQSVGNRPGGQVECRPPILSLRNPAALARSIRGCPSTQVGYHLPTDPLSSWSYSARSVNWGLPEQLSRMPLTKMSDLHGSQICTRSNTIMPWWWRTEGLLAIHFTKTCDQTLATNYFTRIERVAIWLFR